MSQNPYQSLTDSYLELFREHGVSPKSLGWLKGKQHLRFDQLTSGWDLAGKQILDVGCGFGDFITYLQKNGIQDYSYLGVDLIPEFIEVADKTHSDENVEFQCSTIEDAQLNGEFDFAIASGTFNHRIDIPDCYEMVESILTKMLNVSRVGISADFLTDRVDYRYNHNFNYSPTKILDLAYSLSKRVSLRNDRFPFEFSVTIYRDDSFDKSTTLFNGFQESSHP